MGHNLAILWYGEESLGLAPSAWLQDEGSEYGRHCLLLRPYLVMIIFKTWWHSSQAACVSSMTCVASSYDSEYQSSPVMRCPLICISTLHNIDNNLWSLILLFKYMSSNGIEFKSENWWTRVFLSSILHISLLTHKLLYLIQELKMIILIPYIIINYCS
jgi:hypothetical protein